MSDYGFSKIERDTKKAIPNPKAPTAQAPQPLPDTTFGKFIHNYSQDKLPQPVLNHSLRVYQYSLAIIKDHFPNWDLRDDVLFAACLLHDIGTTEHNMNSTKMSFEFYGGLLSRELVLEKTGDKDFAEAVSEAIIRHQDLGDSGFITTLGLILQISTILDNVGFNTNLIHPDTLDKVNKTYSRDGWLNCFAAAIDKENSMKPWGHTSALGVDDFRDGVLSNQTRYHKI